MLHALLFLTHPISWFSGSLVLVFGIHASRILNEVTALEEWAQREFELLKTYYSNLIVPLTQLSTH
jgi:hypothetical protein